MENKRVICNSADLCVNILRNVLNTTCGHSRIHIFNEDRDCSLQVCKVIGREAECVECDKRGGIIKKIQTGKPILNTERLKRKINA